MIPEIGHYALILALCVAVIQGACLSMARLWKFLVDGRCKAGRARTISPGPARLLLLGVCLR